MNQTFFKHKQGTEDWFKARWGKFTASSIWRLLDENEKDLYIREVVAEKLMTYCKKDDSGNYAFAWGHKYEPEALRKIEEEFRCVLLRPGFVESDRYPDWFGASPDAVEESFSFGVEIKCLSETTIGKIVRSETIPWKHQCQITAQMMVCKIPLWAYVVYNPNCTPKLWYKFFSIAEMRELMESIDNSLLYAIEEGSKLLANGGMVWNRK